ncbi:MAG: exopolyphosphatase [Anaerolineales bacterium]
MHLITTDNWDGLVCAVLLSSVEHIEAIQLASPKALQAQEVAVPQGAIIANLPYHPNCALWFDHHISEETRGAHRATGFKGKFGPAPSAARLIYEYYGGATRWGGYAALVDATDRIDSAHLTLEDVLHPTGYILLAYTIDPRTGLKDLDSQAYFLLLMDWLKNLPPAEILELPEVKHITDRLSAEDEQFRAALLQHSRLEANVVITDFRGVEVPPGNRFLVYTLFPQANVSVRLFDSPDGQVSTIAVGHSLFNRTCQTNVGQLLGEYGGGGHRGAGTVRFSKAEAGPKLQAILQRLKAAG